MNYNSLSFKHFDFIRYLSGIIQVVKYGYYNVDTIKARKKFIKLLIIIINIILCYLQTIRVYYFSFSINSKISIFMVNLYKGRKKI